MATYKDARDGTWRYRKQIRLADGRKVRISGTPEIDTKVAAEAAERAAIDRAFHPERYPAAAPAAPQREEVPYFRDFVVRFMAEATVGQKPSELKSKRHIIAGALVPFFGHLRLDEIEQGVVNRFKAEQLQRVAVKTLNNRLVVLSSVLQYAHEVEALPVEPKLRLHVKGPDVKIAAVPMAVVDRLLGAADDTYRAAVLLATEAGLRNGEWRGLQWSKVRDGVLTIDRAYDQLGNWGSPKHGKTRTVPVSARLAEALDRLPRRGLWVVSDAEGDWIRYEASRLAIHEIYDRAGAEAPALPWHGLRHSFGSVAAGRGVPLHVLAELMGHSDIGTTMKYVDVNEQQKAAAIRTAFCQPCANGPAATVADAAPDRG